LASNDFAVKPAQSSVQTRRADNTL